MSAFFVTGSGTDVGKTFVTAGLVRALKTRGRAVDVLKPVVSGYNADNPAGSDPAVLLEALARPQTEENLAQISPWRFRAPLSPDMAAATEGRAIDMAAVTAFCREAAARAKGVLFIEGAGGVMAPFTARQTQLDLMSALEIPLIFVAGSYLGAIGHALTGLDTLKCRGLDLRALVVNETPGSSVDLKATCSSLGNFTAAPVLALRWGDSAANEAAFARLAALV
jgi:dethiobiotin synthetase